MAVACEIGGRAAGWASTVAEPASAFGRLRSLKIKAPSVSISRCTTVKYILSFDEEECGLHPPHSGFSEDRSTHEGTTSFLASRSSSSAAAGEGTSSLSKKSSRV